MLFPGKAKTNRMHKPWIRIQNMPDHIEIRYDLLFSKKVKAIFPFTSVADTGCLSRIRNFSISDLKFFHIGSEIFP